MGCKLLEFGFQKFGGSAMAGIGGQALESLRGDSSVPSSVYASLAVIDNQRLNWLALLKGYFKVWVQISDLKKKEVIKMAISIIISEKGNEFQIPKYETEWEALYRDIDRAHYHQIYPNGTYIYSNSLYDAIDRVDAI